MEIHLEQKQGDILVFLTGQAEIEKACDSLYAKADHIDYRHDVRDKTVEAIMVLPVYGSMPTGKCCVSLTRSLWKNAFAINHNKIAVVVYGKLPFGTYSVWEQR